MPLTKTDQQTSAIRCPWQLFSEFADVHFCHQLIYYQQSAENSLCTTACAHFQHYQQILSVIKEKEKLKERVIDLEQELRVAKASE